jgi:Uma2 family endonuclease
MTVATLPTSEPQTRRWTREEFYKLSEEGWFQGQRVLLLEGEIIQTPAMKHPHAWSTSMAAQVCRRVFGEQHWVREQMPLNATEASDPEPDVLVSELPMASYKDHPVSAILVIEVSDTTLRLDRRKAAVYAEASVKEYWILNLNDRQLEVYRSPNPASRSYRDHRIIKENETVSPLTKPQAIISVKEQCHWSCNIFWFSSSSPCAWR